MTTSAQFRTSSVKAVKNRGRLKWNNGFRGIFSVVFGSLPRREFMATATARKDPHTYPIRTPETPIWKKASTTAIIRLETIKMMVMVAMLPNRESACRLELYRVFRFDRNA